MAEQEKYTVITEVTPEQYETLLVNSQSCKLIANSDGLDRVRESSSIARIISDAILEGCETDEYEDEWIAADNVSMEGIDQYDLAISRWPVTVQSEVLKLAEPYINDHVETGAGYEVYTSIDFGSDGANEFLAHYPQFRVMFLVDPDEVAHWFRL